MKNEQKNMHERERKRGKYKRRDEQAILKASLFTHYKISTKWINILDLEKKQMDDDWNAENEFQEEKPRAREHFP